MPIIYFPFNLKQIELYFVIHLEYGYIWDHKVTEEWIKFPMALYLAWRKEWELVLINPLIKIPPI